MKILPVKGTRDFYPEQMAVRNWIVDGWKAASVRNGFAEYDGPIFEYLQMYKIKSGDEIAEQLFNLTDRGGRDLAIRPEITPTLARMVNQKINALPRPIKWFSVPRLCRAERPQKGRLREFFQWNFDIIGVDDVLADAEVIFTAVDYLRSVGLRPADIVVKVSSRKMMAAILESLSFAEAQLEKLYALLDKKNKLPAETFEKMLAEQVADDAKFKKVLDLMAVGSLAGIGGVVKLDATAQAAVDELRRLFELTEAMGIGEFVQFDIGIVRGLAYYTGVVFEVYDKVGELRAIGGGGRYDNLLEQFGGQAVPATGFGMGDCVLEILLKKRGLLKNAVPARAVDYFVAFADGDLQQRAVEIVAKIRLAGLSAEFSYKSAGLGKQMRQAAGLKAGKCVIIGEEFAVKNELVIKDMATGEQGSVGVGEFFAGI